MVGDLASTSKPPLRHFFEQQKKSLGNVPPGAPSSGCQVEEILAIRQMEENLSCHRHLQEEEVGQVVEEEAQEVGMGSLQATHPQNLTETARKLMPL